MVENGMARLVCKELVRSRHSTIEIEDIDGRSRSMCVHFYACHYYVELHVPTGATLYPFPRLLYKMLPCFHLLENFVKDGFENIPLSVCDEVCVWNHHTRRSQQSYGRIFDVSTL